jgi:hypothetical protein
MSSTYRVEVFGEIEFQGRATAFLSARLGFLVGPFLFSGVDQFSNVRLVFDRGDFQERGKRKWPDRHRKK